MNFQEYQHLLAERGELERLLKKTPTNHVIDRISLKSRLESVNAEIEKTPAHKREPLRARLTFRGKPVVGSHGIFVEFGSNVVNKFADVVAAFAASQTGPLGSTGAIPNRNQNQLLVTGTAVGSFGFELEEHIEVDQLALDIPSPIGEAMEQARALMQASVGTDDELADAASELDPRAVKELHGFIKVLADQEAVCALAFGDKNFRFQGVGEVRRSVERLSQDNLHEGEETFIGIFLGVRPEIRDFEFRIQPDDKIIRGKVSKSIGNAAEINRHHLEKLCRISVQMTQVGNGRPRYVLLSYAEEPQAGDMP